MDEDVVVATSMILMMAGYDTTATLLSYTSYALSKNPEVQTKLQEEVDEAFAGAEEEFPDYSVIQVHSKCRNRSKLLPPPKWFIASIFIVPWLLGDPGPALLGHGGPRDLEDVLPGPF